MFGKKSREWITYSGIAALLVTAGSLPAVAMPGASSPVRVTVEASAQPLVQDVRWRRDRHRGRDAAIAGAAGLVGGMIIGSAIANSNGYYDDYPPPRRYYRERRRAYYYDAPPPPPRRVVVERRVYEVEPSYGYYREHRRPHYYVRQDDRYSNY